MPLNCQYSFSKSFEDSTFCHPILQMKRSSQRNPTFYWINFKDHLKKTPPWCVYVKITSFLFPDLSFTFHSFTTHVSSYLSSLQKHGIFLFLRKLRGANWRGKTNAVCYDFKLEYLWRPELFKHHSSHQVIKNQIQFNSSVTWFCLKTKKSSYEDKSSHRSNPQDYQEFLLICEVHPSGQNFSSNDHSFYYLR